MKSEWKIVVPVYIVIIKRARRAMRRDGVIPAEWVVSISPGDKRYCPGIFRYLLLTSPCRLNNKWQPGNIINKWSVGLFFIGRRQNTETNEERNWGNRWCIWRHFLPLFYRICVSPLRQNSTSLMVDLHTHRHINSQPHAKSCVSLRYHF